VLGPDGGERTETARSGNVANEANDDERGGFDNGNRLDDLLFVHLGAGTFQVTDNVSHASLVPDKGGQVDRLTGIILRK